MHHKILERFYLISICLLPLFILSGPFIPDLIISIAAIVFLLFNSNYIYNNFNRFLFVFFSYFIYIILSSLFSQDLYSIVHTTVHIRFFVLYFIFDYLIKNYKNIFLNLFLVSIFSSLFIIILIFVYDILSGNINLDISNVAFDYQYSGIFSEEKKLGSIIFFYLSLFLSLIIKFKKTSYTRSILTLFFISILSLIVYFTAERKTILLLVIFLFFYIFLIINNKKSKIILVLISVIISSLIILLTPAVIKDRVFNHTISSIKLNQFPNDVYFNQYKIFDNFNFFSSQHEVYFYTAFNIFKDNMIFGSGPSTFRKQCIYDKYMAHTDIAISCSTHPHNFYIQALSETGIIGLLFIIMFLFFNFWIIFFKKSNKNSKNLILNSFCLINICNFFPFIPTGSLFNNANSLILFISIFFTLYYYFNYES